MLILITGLPGASKTLNAIKYVREDDLFLELDADGNPVLIDGKPKRRPVFYHNINQLKFEDWTLLTDDEAKQPDQIPAGSVIIYDECQDIFPVLPQSKSGNIPAHYTYMNKHRHNGHDVILITQHPKNLNTQLRRLVNKHIHYKRQFGGKKVTVFEFLKCYDEPEDHFSKKEAQVSTIEIDSKYFGAYKSAEVHTMKKKLPIKKLFQLGFFVLLTLCAIGGAIYALVGLAENQLNEFDDTPEEEASELPSGVSRSTSSRSGSLTFDQYLEMHTPRIPDLPSSAPVYDDLTQPVSFPRIAGCVYKPVGNVCRCYTQQATRIDVSFNMCVNIVDRGYFDSSKPDHDDRDRRRTDRPGRYASSTSSEISPRSILITHTPQDRIQARPSRLGN